MSGRLACPTTYDGCLMPGETPRFTINPGLAIARFQAAGAAAAVEPGSTHRLELHFVRQPFSLGLPEFGCHRLDHGGPASSSYLAEHPYRRVPRGRIAVEPPGPMRRMRYRKPGGMPHRASAMRGHGIDADHKIGRRHRRGIFVERRAGGERIDDPRRGFGKRLCGGAMLQVYKIDCLE